MENYRAPVPSALAGAKTVTTPEAHALWAAKNTVFIDVMPRVARPPDLPADVIFRERARKNIPGSAWLPDVGYGRLSATLASYFERALETLSKGRKDMPLLFYCLTDCWMSWNAAKRAMQELGYTNVLWYPEGTDIWAFEGYPVEDATPFPGFPEGG